MRAEPEPHLIEALSEMLRLEADRVEVALDAKARLDRRTAGQPAPRARPRRRVGPAVAVLALGLVLVVVVLISSGGWHRTATPAPVASPTPTATSSARDSIPGLAEPDLPTTLIYYPRPDGRLVAEPRSRTTLAAAVKEISGEPSNEEVAWPFGSMKLESVTEQDGTVTVDYSRDDHIRPGDPDVKTAGFWAQSLVHTVAAYTGEQEPALITLRGRSFELFDRLDTREPIDYEVVDEGRWTGVSLPTQVPTTSPATVVGAVGPHVDHLTFGVLEAGTDKTLLTGTAPVHADRTYSFALTAPPGRYDLRVYAGDPREKSTPSYLGGFNVE